MLSVNKRKIRREKKVRIIPEILTILLKSNLYSSKG
jgi:hypothetical protein